MGTNWTCSRAPVREWIGNFWTIGSGKPNKTTVEHLLANHSLWGPSLFCEPKYSGQTIQHPPFDKLWTRTTNFPNSVVRKMSLYQLKQDCPLSPKTLSLDFFGMLSIFVICCLNKLKKVEHIISRFFGKRNRSVLFIFVFIKK